jgi:hypothetical protein
MTDVSLHLAPEPRAPAAILRERHPALASVGLAFLALALVTAALPAVDARLIDGVSVWAKPSKFFLSSGLLLITSAWFFGYVRPERRDAGPLKVGARLLIGFAAFELAYITFQAARGQPSHFNHSDVAHSALFAMMGAAAIGMLLTKIPLALEIWRRPAAGLSPDLRLAAALGLGLTAALGILSGVAIAMNGSHNVGAVGGAAPIFGWNRTGGDLRVAHFFGMHAEQVLPIAAALAGATAGAGWTRRLVLAAAALICAATGFALVQAAMGRPFPFG